MLPTPSKNAKKRLRMHGVEARRTGLAKGTEAGKGAGPKKGKTAGRMQISTKSGFERRMENRKRGAIEGSKRRKALDTKGQEGEEADEGSEWSGFGE
jgi:ATP-dependent RNA helicase DDX52/ROK1